MTVHVKHMFVTPSPRVLLSFQYIYIKIWVKSSQNQEVDILFGLIYGGVYARHNCKLFVWQTLIPSQRDTIICELKFKISKEDGILMNEGKPIAINWLSFIRNNLNSFRFVAHKNERKVVRRETTNSQERVISKYVRGGKKGD